MFKRRVQNTLIAVGLVGAFFGAGSVIYNDQRMEDLKVQYTSFFKTREDLDSLSKQLNQYISAHEAPENLKEYRDLEQRHAALSSQFTAMRDSPEGKQIMKLQKSYAAYMLGGMTLMLLSAIPFGSGMKSLEERLRREEKLTTPATQTTYSG